MLMFKKLTVNNAILFSKATLNLDNQGVVFVSGFNADVAKATGSYSSNAVGKSAIFEIIKYIINDDQLRDSSKDFIATGTGFKGVLEFELDGDSYTITKYRKHHKHKNKVFITKNGKNVTPKGGLPRVKKFLRELLPLKDDDYYSYVHMSPTNFSPIINGRNSLRFSYLSTLLGLDFYDSVRYFIKKRLDGWSQKRQDVDAIKAEIKQIESVLEDRSDLTFAVQSLDRRLQYLNEFEAYLTELRRRADNTVSLLDRAIVLSYKLNSKNNKDGRSNYTLLQNKHKQMLAWLKQNARRFENGSAYYTAKKELIKARKKLQSFGKEAVFFAKNREAYERVSVAMWDLPEEFHVHLQKRKEYEQFVHDTDTERNTKLIQTEPKLLQKAGAIKGQMEHCRNRMKALKQLKGKGKCPTCETTLSAKELKMVWRGYARQLSKLEERLVLIEDKIALVEKAKTEQEAVSKIQKILAAIPKKVFPDAFVRLLAPERLNHLQEIFKTLHHYFILTDMMAESEPAPRDFMDKYRAVMKQEQQLLKKVNAAQKQEYIHRSIKALGVNTTDIKELKQQKAVAVSETNKITRKLREVVKRRSALIDRRGRLSELTKTRSSLKKRLEMLNKKLIEANSIEVRVKILKDIYNAYGPKGLKYKHIRKLASVLTRKLNYYASFLFGSKVQFEISPKENAIEFMYKKAGGKEGDIRTMSSGEKRRLTLALIPAILNVVPRNKRTNVLILDEIDSNVDEDGKVRMDEFIPKLKKLFSTIFVVSPSKTPFKNIDKHIRVVLSKGVSWIKQIAV